MNDAYTSTYMYYMLYATSILYNIESMEISTKIMKLFEIHTWAELIKSHKQVKFIERNIKKNRKRKRNRKTSK